MIHSYTAQAEAAQAYPASDIWERPSRFWKGGGKPRYAQFDFETYCSQNIRECGGYRYIDDDSFEPLLLAAAFDDEDVFIIDLACGEDVPDIVWAAVHDPEIRGIHRRCGLSHLHRSPSR